MKKSKLSETNKNRLKAFKKAMRETTHVVKPMVTINKKKQANKMACRKTRDDAQGT